MLLRKKAHNLLNYNVYPEAILYANMCTVGKCREPCSLSSLAVLLAATQGLREPQYGARRELNPRMH